MSSPCMYMQFISWSVLECSFVYMGFHYPFMILAVIVVSEDGSSEQE